MNCNDPFLHSNVEADHMIILELIGRAEVIDFCVTPLKDNNCMVSFTNADGEKLELIGDPLKLLFLLFEDDRECVEWRAQNNVI